MHLDSGRIDIFRDFHPVGDFVRPTAVRVPGGFGCFLVGIGRLEVLASQGRSWPCTFPTTRQEAVVLYRFTTADETGREPPRRIPEEYLVHLHLVRGRDDLVVFLVALT